MKIFYITTILLISILTTSSVEAKKKELPYERSEVSEHGEREGEATDKATAEQYPQGAQAPIEEVELPTCNRDVALSLGVKAYRKQDWNNAAEQLQKALTESSDLDIYIRPLLARALVNSQRYSEAFPILILPVKSAGETDLENLCTKTEAAIGSDQFGEAQTLIARLTKESAALKSHKEELLYLQGWMAVKKGQGYSVWKKLLTQYAGSAPESNVLRQLANEGKSLEKTLNAGDWLARAKSFMENGLAVEAVPIYEKYGSKQDIALAVFKSRDYPRASRLLEELVAQTQDNDLLYKLALSYGRSDQFDKAMEAYKKLIKVAPQSNAATEARYKIPFIYFDSGQYDKAFLHFSQYVNGKNKYKIGDAKTYYLWSAFLTRQYDTYLKALELGFGKSKDKWAIAYYNYWKARALEESGSKNFRQYYEAARSATPSGYYGFLATQRLMHGHLNGNQMISPDALDFVPRGRSEWSEGDAESSPCSKAIRLARVGLFKEAYVESEKTAAAGSEASSNISLFAQATNFKKVTSIGNVALKGNPTSSSSLYWSAAFPQAYKELVTGFSRQWGLNPHLAWAIMREESAFKPFVESHAAAIGLMQIIPPTGLEIARALNDTDFHPEDLSNPWVNIRYGTWYLNKISGQFGGVPYYGIASYNAGPDAVARWKKWGDRMEPDLFVELIPYDETRDYVKKVMKGYWIYKKLYE